MKWWEEIAILIAMVAPQLAVFAKIQTLIHQKINIIACKLKMLKNLKVIQKIQILNVKKL